MLTVIAWMVFIPAVIWNTVFFGYAVLSSKPDWKMKQNWRDAAISLTVLMVPGVYLFGLY